MFYSALRQSNPPEALERRSVRFSVRQMNTFEPPFNHFKLDFILSLSPGKEQGDEWPFCAGVWNKWASALVLINEASWMADAGTPKAAPRFPAPVTKDAKLTPQC